MEDLQTLIDDVIRTRDDAESYRRNVSLLREDWEHEHADFILQCKEAQDQSENAESALRCATIAAYERTGEKAPALGLGIRVITVLNYDSDTALEWATEHDMALMLDKKAFESIAKVDKKMAFVTRTEKVTATIATDLASAAVGARQS